MKMFAEKEIEKFKSLVAYIDEMSEQYNQGYRLGLRERFEKSRRYVMTVDVKSMEVGDP